MRFALQSINPKLADDLPKSIDLALLKLKQRDFARGTLEFAASIRWLGLVAPLIAILVLLGAVLLEPDRRLGILRAALAIAAAGAVIAIVYLILRARILAGVIGSQELTDQDVRGAVAGILDAFVGGLFTWGLVLGLVGLVVAGAAAALDPDRTSDPVMRLQRVDHAAARRARSGGSCAAWPRSSPASSSRSTGSSRSASSACSPAPSSSTSARASCSSCSAAAAPSRRRRAVCAGAASGARSPSSPWAWGSWSPR